MSNGSTPTAMEGLRVLELGGGVAGSFCTKLLADFGAEVIKVEPPKGGDECRSWGPFYHDEPTKETSGLFLYLNTNKKSISLDLNARETADLFRDLVRVADVLVEAFEPGYLAGLGWDYRNVSMVNPGITYTSITPFGQTGHYRQLPDNELLVLALSGFLYLTGEPGRRPIKPYGFVTSYMAGLQASIATLIAWHGRSRTGRGCNIDVSAAECMSLCNGGAAAWYRLFGEVCTRAGTKVAQLIPDLPYPAALFPCKDGYVHVNSHLPEHLAVLTENPDLARPDMWMKTHAEEVDAALTSYLRGCTRQDVVARAQELRLPFAEVLDIDEVLEDPQLAAREFFVTIDHPRAGVLKYPGAPVKMSGTPWRAGRAPLHGEHNEEVFLGLLNYKRERLARLVEVGAI